MLRVGDFAKIDIAKMRKTMRFGGAALPRETSVVNNGASQEDIFRKIRLTQIGKAQET